MATDPYWSTLSPELQRALQGNNDTIQSQLVQPLYRECTANDPFSGQWEPEDTGSDGLTLGKMLKARGLISGYQHATSIAACHVAIQNGPFAVGIPWYQNMFYPDPNGVVVPSGAMVGGHEIVCDEYDLDRDLWWYTNSWSDGWGIRGRFAMSSATFQTLLSRQGDATHFVPVTAPAPKPTDPPGPVSPVPPAPDFPYGPMDIWANRASTAWPRYQRDAAAAYKAWRKTQR
jgi:hypothetical protein